MRRRPPPPTLAIKPAPAATEVFPETEDISHAVNVLLREATDEVWLVSPYVSLDKLAGLQRTISETLERGVGVHLFIREDGVKTQQVAETAASLVDLGLDLRCVPNLHAKVYLSDQAAIVTSLNLLASSVNNSIEVGIQVGLGSTRDELLAFIEKKVMRNARLIPDEDKPEPSASAPQKKTASKVAEAPSGASGYLRETEKVKARAEASSSYGYARQKKRTKAKPNAGHLAVRLPRFLG